MTDFARWEASPIPPPLFGEEKEVPAPKECGEPLLDITTACARVAFDASYHKRGLPHALTRCWLRRAAAEKLLAAAERLPAGWSFLIFDTLRPLAVQQALYDELWGQLRRRHPEFDDAQLRRIISDFVALPRKSYEKPAPHTTGGAVDLTLCFQGVPLDMGTGFDDFSPRACTRFLEEHAQTETERRARQNRRLLYHMMTGAGFVNYSGEWWHFSYGDRAWARQLGETPCYSYIEAPAPTEGRAG